MYLSSIQIFIRSIMYGSLFSSSKPPFGLFGFSRLLSQLLDQLVGTLNCLQVVHSMSEKESIADSFKA